MRGHLSTPDRRSSKPVRLGGVVSLEWKLPLLMTGFLAAGVAVMLAVTYLTLVQRSEAMVRDRLHHAAREVASTAAETLAGIAQALQEAARDSSIRSVLLASDRNQALDPAEVAAVRDVLTRLARPGSTLPVELWDARGRRLAMVGQELPASERQLPTLQEHAGEAAPGLVRFGPLHRLGDGVGFWAVAPVLVEGKPLGFIAQPRRAGGPRDAVQSLRELLREEVNLYTSNADGTLWIAAPDLAATAPTRRDSTESGIWYTREGIGRLLAAEAPVVGTPWVMVLETPEEWILRRSRSTVITLAMASLALVLVGAFFSWVTSRRITGPLAELTAAAEAVALGRYERSVAGTGRDEIGRLAASFDAMARQVAAVRSELEERVVEAQTTARELESTNQQLLQAMREAEIARADAERARLEAENANRAKGDFLAVMSHELRTPLNAIGGYAQLLELGIHGPVNEAQKEALVRIGRSQAHLLTLINDVLNFARIDAGQVQYAISDVRLHETLVELEALVEPQVRASALTFGYHPCDPGLLVRADRDKLRQIVLNLLSNAIKYTPKGGSVTIHCEAEEQQVRVHVRDTGTGIRPERLPLIFGAFVQGERALNRPDEGVGLGLAISRDLARAMGGDLLVESEPGIGSTFTLLIPRTENAKPTSSGSVPSSASSDGAVPLPAPPHP